MKREVKKLKLPTKWLEVQRGLDGYILMQCTTAKTVNKPTYIKENGAFIWKTRHEAEAECKKWGYKLGRIAR